MSVVTCRSCGTANTTFNAFCHECSGALSFVGDGPKSAATAGYNRILFLEGTVVGRYEIKRLIGAGGAGEVYAAVERDSGRRVALKFLSSDLTGDAKARERLRREARAIRALDHPGIAKVFEVAEAEGRPYIAMELHEGRALTDRFARGPVPLLELVRIGAEIASALHATHCKGIVHRDVKPANVLLTVGGQVRLVDFGLAKVATLIDGTKLTRTGAVIGTMAYMPPEQLAGEAVDHRADVWSLGVVLYEGAFGRLPFWGQGLARRILTDPPAGLDEPPLELPAGLVRLLGSMLEKDPRKRIQSAARVEEALRALLRSSGDEVPKLRRRSSSWLVVFLARAAAAAAIAVLAFAAYWKWRPGAAPPPAAVIRTTTAPEIARPGEPGPLAPSARPIPEEVTSPPPAPIDHPSTRPKERRTVGAATAAARPSAAPPPSPAPADPIGLPEKPF
jgi:serine/threonine protein kinase